MTKIEYVQGTKRVIHALLSYKIGFVEVFAFIIYVFFLDHHYNITGATSFTEEMVIAALVVIGFSLITTIIEQLIILTE